MHPHEKHKLILPIKSIQSIKSIQTLQPTEKPIFATQKHKLTTDDGEQWFFQILLQ